MMRCEVCAALQGDKTKKKFYDHLAEISQGGLVTCK